MSHGHEPDVAQYFGRLAARTSVGDLDDAAVTAAKMSVLDTIGVALAATSAEPAVATVIELVLADGGRPEAAVWGSGRRVPAAGAAFANGAMAHGLDFDDQTPWGQHASSSVVPAALAVADRRGAISGAELVTAVAVGQDIFARLRCHVGWRKDWNPPACSACTRAPQPRRGFWAFTRAMRARARHRQSAVLRGDGGGRRHRQQPAQHVRGVLGAGGGAAALLAERGLTGVARGSSRVRSASSRATSAGVTTARRCWPTWARTSGEAAPSTRCGRRSEPPIAISMRWSS